MVSSCARDQRPEQERKHDPDSEISECADEEKGNVQICGFALQVLIKPNFLGACPGIQDRQVAGHGQEENGQREQGHGPRLHRSTDRQGPRASDQVMKHRDSQRAQRDSNPEEEAHEIGSKEVMRPDQSPRQADGQTDDPDPEQAHLKTIKLCPEVLRPVLPGHSVSSWCDSLDLALFLGRQTR